MKQKPYYGYYCENIITSTFKLTILSLLTLEAYFLNVPPSIIGIMIAIECSYFGYLLFHGKNFTVAQKEIVDKMIHLSHVSRNTIVLDLGAGNGVLGINFAKKIDKGKVYLFDLWYWSFRSLLSSPLLLMTIMTGCTLENVKRNAFLKGVADRCEYKKGDLADHLDFSDDFFDIIVSSQSLYYLKTLKIQKQLFYEIDRVLKKDGKILLYEPNHPVENRQWNMKSVKKFFDQIGYETELIPVTTVRGWRFNASILVGIKK